MNKLIVLLIIICFLCPLSYAQPAIREQEAVYVAKKAYEDGFYEVSLNLFQRFLKNYPESQKAPEVNLYIAQCYFQQEKFIAALARLEKLYSDPAAAALKDTVLYWTGEVHFRGKDFNKASSFYKKILKEFPESGLLIHAYYSLGWCLFESGDFPAATQIFKKIINDSPDGPLAQDAHFKNLECLYNLKNYEALKKEILVFQNKYPVNKTYTSRIHFLLAECSFYLDDYKGAIQEYQTAINDCSDKKIISLSQLGLAWSYLKTNNYIDAGNLLNSINADDLINEAQEGFLLAKANLFIQAQDLQGALEIWLRLQKIAVSLTIKMQAYLGRAETLYNLERYPEAIDVYQEAKNISSGCPSELLDKLYYGLAWAFLKNGQFREAIVEFQKAASLASGEIIKVAALCQVGDTYQDAEEYPQAIQVYNQILKDYPKSFYVDYVQYQLGLVCLRLSRYEDAILAFRTLLLNFPKSKLYPKAIYSLALGFFQKQDYQGSLQALRKYMPDLKNNEIEAESLYLMATSFYNLGNFPEAMNIFKQVIRKTDDIKIIQKAEYEIADCFYQMGNEKEAMGRFKALRSKYSDSALSPEVTWWLGGYYFRKGDLALSRRYFSSLIRDFPKSGLLADGYYALGLLDQEEEKLDSALDNFKKAIESGSRDIKAQANIAIADILIERDEFDEAEAAYREAIKNSPAL
ncbi:MAG: tetratricopeptide repeat protein, partial [Candidatus Omnitrophota bacterium]